MHRIILTILSFICVLSTSGCTKDRASLNNFPPNVELLSSIPQDAELVYSYTPIDVYGKGITTDSWNHTDDTGFWVLEFLCNSGSIQQMELRQTAGETIVSFGNIQEDGVFITDIVTDAAGDYTLYLGNADYFSGEVNVYFVPGIGYSTDD